MFRNCKLREVIYPGETPKTVALTGQIDGWLDNQRTFLIFDEQPSANSPNALDLPSNMLSDKAKDPAAGRDLTWKQQETLFYQARGFDGCYKSVSLLQHFFDLYGDHEATPHLLVRHGPKGKEPGRSYTTTIECRRIIEQTLLYPKYTTASIVLPEGLTHVMGHQAVLLHVTMGFYEEDADREVSSTLDLASMQLGDVGRGPGAKGKGTFALDTIDEYKERLMQLADGNDAGKARSSLRVGPSEHDWWLKDVARRAKARWDKRETAKWCGHCGGPGPELLRCSRCGSAWFCDREHQRMAWHFHKGYCKD